MTVKQLNRDQLVSLKQQMLTDNGKDVSYGELADADNLVSDEEVFDRYEGVSFGEEDFV